MSPAVHTENLPHTTVLRGSHSCHYCHSSQVNSHWTKALVLTGTSAQPNTNVSSIKYNATELLVYPFLISKEHSNVSKPKTQ